MSPFPSGIAQGSGAGLPATFIAATVILLLFSVGFTAMTRYVDEAGARTLNLDRHWRNIRTVSTHNPLAYKAYVAGDYAVNGAWPPANGYF
jgi:hypothetical protein